MDKNCAISVPCTHIMSCNPFGGKLYTCPLLWDICIDKLTWSAVLVFTAYDFFCAAAAALKRTFKHPTMLASRRKTSLLVVNDCLLYACVHVCPGIACDVKSVHIYIERETLLPLFESEQSNPEHNVTWSWKRQCRNCSCQKEEVCFFVYVYVAGRWC